eukprot:m.20086 g.20086  ORF g.20086 m.20086 type:complete len:1168 (+) comp12740_c0_seq1:136-3639(+)
MLWAFMFLMLVLNLDCTAQPHHDQHAKNIVVHVSSTHGSDVTGSGSLTSPFQSLAKAQIAVQKHVVKSSSHSNITIALGAGAYLNTSLVFTELDSPPGSSLTIQGPTSVEQATATVYGGQRIDFNGWQPYTDSIWKTHLPSDLVDSNGKARFHTLVQNDRSAWLARSPNFGSGFLPCGGGNSGFTCPPDVLPDQFDCVNSSCSVFTRAGYSSDIRAVTSVNLETHSVTIQSNGVDPSRGDFYLQGALELLDQEGEWAVQHGILYFWPYSKQGRVTIPTDESIIITAPVTQRVFSFVGKSSASPVTGLSIQNVRIVGSSMPSTYTYACHASGGGDGADCAADGGPDTPDQTNTSPLAASQGMVYLENASNIKITDCTLLAAGIAAFWFQESNTNHTIEGNWVEDIGGFGLYSNGIGVGDRRYSSPTTADVNHGHLITNNVFRDGGRQIEYGSGVWLFQTGSTTITHNIIKRFPRDGVGFYGMLPYWTADPGGPVAPGMPPAINVLFGSRTPWGKFVTWNGDAGGSTSSNSTTWSTWDVLFNRNNYLAWNDISNCNRQGLDGGVIESWGSSRNNTWEFNAVHDNEGYGGLSLLFADDFSPSLVMQKNIIFENNCPVIAGANCATFMMKSVNVSAVDNIVADMNYSRVFEVAAYRMPAANMAVRRNVVWNTTQRRAGATTYTCSCGSKFANGSTWQNASLADLLMTGDGSSSQRSRMKQYGLGPSQLLWPLVSVADNNFVSNLTELRASGCTEWDRSSIELDQRPFTPVNGSRPWHSTTVYDFAIANNSNLVTEHGFLGSFDVTKVGLTPSFSLTGPMQRVSDAFGLIHAERYDRTSNLWTVEATGLGTSPNHFDGETAYSIPPGSWARYDDIDFGSEGGLLKVQAFVKSVSGGANISFKLTSPDTSGTVLARLVIPAASNSIDSNSMNSTIFMDTRTSSATPGYALYNGTVGDVGSPTGIHPVFMVFESAGSVPSPRPADNSPHRYWRLMAIPSDFNTSFYNANWHVCAMELRSSVAGTGDNLATNPHQGFASSGVAAKAFDGVDNCTQWDGHGGALSDMWTPNHPEHDHQWVAYDFGTPVDVQSIRLKQFPNQYCASTPSLQYSDDKQTWTTKIKMLCDSQCPNNATGAEPDRGWVESPGPGTVAPPSPPLILGIGATVDWFSFQVEA